MAASRRNALRAGSASSAAASASGFRVVPGFFCVCPSRWAGGASRTVSIRGRLSILPVVARDVKAVGGGAVAVVHQERVARVQAAKDSGEVAQVARVRAGLRAQDEGQLAVGRVEERAGHGGGARGIVTEDEGELAVDRVEGRADPGPKVKPGRPRRDGTAGAVGRARGE